MLGGGIVIGVGVGGGNASSGDGGGGGEGLINTNEGRSGQVGGSEGDRAGDG